MAKITALTFVAYAPEVKRAKEIIDKLYFAMEELDYDGSDPKFSEDMDRVHQEISNAQDCLSAALEGINRW